MADWSKLKVVDLRAELKSRGLPAQGLKQDLVQRLTEYDSQQADTGDADDAGDEVVADPIVDAAMASNDDPNGADEQTQHMEPSLSEVQADSAVEAVAVTHATDGVTPVTTDQTEATPDTPQETQKRKRPSESPQLSPESKRVKAIEREVPVQTSVSDAVQANDPQTEPSQNFDTFKDTSDATATQGSPKQMATELPRPMEVDEKNDQERTGQRSPSPHHDGALEGESQDRLPTSDKKVEISETIADEAERQEQRKPSEEPPVAESMDAERSVEPAMHPATRALYVKNFMRPLRPNEVKTYFLQCATPPSQEHNPDDIEIFYLDAIRTHAFVVFGETSKAVRCRTALHGIKWPSESTRKELWADFVPPEKVQSWIDEEEASHAGGRPASMTRWEVFYDRDMDGNVEVFLQPATTAQVPERRPSKPINSLPPSVPSGPANLNKGPSANAIPLGPRNGLGGQVPPTGPRGHSSALASGSSRTTRCDPPITFQMVSEDVARKRVDAIRSHYTRDTYRNLGREDEINRYSFESGDVFVDRGKEVFVGIRPPHREAERRRPGGGRGPGPRGPPPPGPRRQGRRRGPRRGGGGGGGGRPMSDRYLPGISESGPFRQGDRGRLGGSEAPRRRDDSFRSGGRW